MDQRNGHLCQRRLELPIFIAQLLGEFICQNPSQSLQVRTKFASIVLNILVTKLKKKLVDNGIGKRKIMYHSNKKLVDAHEYKGLNKAFHYHKARKT